MVKTMEVPRAFPGQLVHLLSAQGDALPPQNLPPPHPTQLLLSGPPRWAPNHALFLDLPLCGNLVSPRRGKLHEGSVPSWRENTGD